MDALCRARTRHNLTVCQHHRFLARRRVLVDQLFAWFGLAAVLDGLGCRSFSGVFQASPCLPVGSVHCQRGIACHRRRDDLCQFAHDDYEFFGAAWHRLVSGPVTFTDSSPISSSSSTGWSNRHVHQSEAHGDAPVTLKGNKRKSDAYVVWSVEGLSEARTL